MTKKELAKKYIIRAVSMFAALFLISALIVFSLNGRGSMEFEFPHLLLLALAGAIIPCGSFTGFVMVFTEIKKLTKFWKIAICIFFPVTLAVITMLGILSFLPYTVYSLAVIIKNK